MGGGGRGGWRLRNGFPTCMKGGGRGGERGMPVQGVVGQLRLPFFDDWLGATPHAYPLPLPPALPLERLLPQNLHLLPHTWPMGPNAHSPTHALQHLLPVPCSQLQVPILRPPPPNSELKASSSQLPAPRLDLQKLQLPTSSSIPIIMNWAYTCCQLSFAYWFAFRIWFDISSMSQDSHSHIDVTN